MYSARRLLVVIKSPCEVVVRRHHHIDLPAGVLKVSSLGVFAVNLRSVRHALIRARRPRWTRSSTVGLLQAQPQAFLADRPRSDLRRRGASTSTCAMQKARRIRPIYLPGSSFVAGRLQRRRSADSRLDSLAASGRADQRPSTSLSRSLRGRRSLCPSD